MVRKGKSDSAASFHDHLVLQIKAAGQNSHGIVAARKPAVGWNLVRPSINGPKP